MSWAIKLGDTEYKLDDIPIAKFASIASRHSMSWQFLLNSPAWDASAFVDIVAVICELHPEAKNAELPDLGGSIGALRALVDLVVEVEPDEVTEWDDGVPKAEPDPATTP